jgi:hypothetical protein
VRACRMQPHSGMIGLHSRLRRPAPQVPVLHTIGLSALLCCQSSSRCMSVGSRAPSAARLGLRWWRFHARTGRTALQFRHARHVVICRAGYHGLMAAVR